MVASAFSVHISALLKRIGQDTDTLNISEEDIALLEMKGSDSGFRNVYAKRNGWHAKVKEGGRLMAIPGSRQPTPQQAAAFVIAWYRARFGESWRVALANRKRPYWRVRYMASYGGWILDVWANGRAVTVRAPGDNSRPTDRPHVFPLRSQAVYYAKYELPKQRRTWAAWRA